MSIEEKKHGEIICVEIISSFNVELDHTENGQISIKRIPRDTQHEHIMI